MVRLSCPGKPSRPMVPSRSTTFPTTTLRACLRRGRPSAGSAAIQHGYELPTQPNQPVRRPVGRYTGSDPGSQTGRQAAHDGPAAGDERHPLHHGDGRSMADAASGVPAVADGVQLLPRGAGSHDIFTWRSYISIARKRGLHLFDAITAIFAPQPSAKTG